MWPSGFGQKVSAFNGGAWWKLRKSLGGSGEEYKVLRLLSHLVFCD